MGPVLHGVEALSSTAAELLVGSVWKGLVLVLCVALLLRCLPRLGAGVRSAIWTVVLLLVMALPLLSITMFSVRWDGVRETPFSPGVVHASVAWSLVITGAWALLSLWRLMQLAASVLRLRRIARGAVPVVPSVELTDLLGKGGRPVALCVSADVSRPSVAGFFRSRILLPVGLLEELSEPELQHVVLHEMEHLRRRDDWINLLQKLSLALFPLHPVLLWLDRRLCVERELACDDGVLRVTRARKAYAACLARLAEDSMVRRGLTLALGLLGVRARRSELSRRVHRILGSPVAAMGRGQVCTATALLLAGIVGGSVMLARSPRLISFTTATTPAVTAKAQAPISSLNAEAYIPHTVVSAQASERLARAVMPQRPGKLAAMTTLAPHQHRELRRIASARRSADMASSYAVFTAWQQGMMTPHLTLAVSRYSQYPQESQQTYAAVPVRGGWLLIQL